MSNAAELPRIEDLVDLAHTAGEVLVARFPRQSDRSYLEIEFKGLRDLVTAADLASETLILDGIARFDPAIPILSEERGDPGVREGLLWIVDPLDGTTNYAHGHPLYTVSIALCRDGEPLLGVVHAPALGDTWWATRGGGTFRNGEPVRVSDEDELVRALLATGFSYGREELERGALEVFGQLLRDSREIRRGGSACLDLAHVACGIFAGYWESHLKPHDVAAGVLLVKEAGGVVTDFSGGDEWLYGQRLIAGNESIHRELLSAVGTA
jgi:myo-inositol-1(or 4)-monophosphatase